LTCDRLGSSKLVIIGGLAELFSGAISMGLGAYLAAVTERDHYLNEEKREASEVIDRPEDEKAEIYEIMHDYGISREATKPLVDQLALNPVHWVRVRIPYSYHPFPSATRPNLSIISS
jgi:VIT1/CCC1 family predicted Fe2+/Mn2+ transporter